MTALSRAVLLAGAAALLPACASIGAGSVHRDRLDYNQALATSWKEQMLLNVVRLRYADTPVFLDVSSVISSYQVQSQFSLLGTMSSGLTPGLPDTTGRGATLGASGTYTDRPTVSYTPLQGDKFTRELLRPIPPAALLQLIQAGYPVDAVFQLAVRAINGVYNRSARPLWARSADPEFYQLLDALRRIQLSEALGFRLERRGSEEVSLIAFRSDRVTPAVLDDTRLVRTLLRIGNDAREVNLTFGAVPRNDRELALLTRSMLDVLLELSAQVEAPAADVEAGRAFPVPPAGPESGPRDQPLIRVLSGTEPPTDAFVTVWYGGHWFWIDNRDFRSKTAFTFLLMLTSLAGTGAVPQAPVITIPAS
ncbi:MAG: hypothetical protein MUF57_01925 [Gammaproteobacteria bacterium]|nr:hypothetical protein [Gammaproteobacteria bacterium]